MADHEHKEGEGESHGGGGGPHGGGHGHGGGGHEGEHEGAPEWLISFADNVALLMGFFVILLAMNMATKHTGGIGSDGDQPGYPKDPMMEFVQSVRESFNSPVKMDSKRPEDQELIRYILRKQGATNEEGPGGKNPGLQSIRTGDYHRISATVAFDDREAGLDAEGRRILAETAAKLKDEAWIIEVRGHVSPFEVMRNPVRARELSYQRAMAAAAALVESGLKWDNLRVVACGDASRVVARATNPADNRQNQRVEILVTNETVAADPYTRPPGGNAEPSDSPEPSEPTSGRR